MDCWDFPWGLPVWLARAAQLAGCQQEKPESSGMGHPQRQSQLACDKFPPQALSCGRPARWSDCTVACLAIPRKQVAAACCVFVPLLVCSRLGRLVAKRSLKPTSVSALAWVLSTQYCGTRDWD